ncbi:uncharacterized protein LOC125489525 [Plutella xylostella]|uniref:uncharacterized protein LOC125489525 n=1 Tax=Plutella xylostella TaxID=51655 RepID=UPI0020329A5D|nr:uncharacterized protein LOC125489525 [Plutella xylostella]
MLLPPQFRHTFSIPEIVMMPGYNDKPINFPVNPSNVHPYPPIWPLDQNENDDTSTVNPNMQPAIVEIVQQQYNDFKTHPLIWSLVQNAKDYVTNEDQLVDYPYINPYVPYPLIWTGEENENDDAMLINLNIPPTNKDEVDDHVFPIYRPNSKFVINSNNILFVDPIKTPNGLDWIKLPNIDFISPESIDVRPLTYYYDKPEITYWFPSYESTQLFSPVAQMPEWIENGPPIFGKNSHDSMMEDLPCDFYRTSCKIIRIVSYLIHEKPVYEYAIDCNNHTNEQYEVVYDNVSNAPKLEMYPKPFGWQNIPLIFNEWIERQWKLIRNTSRTLTCHSFKVLVEKILLDNYIILADDGYLIDASGRVVGTNELIMSTFSIGQPINITPIRSNFNISENSLLFKGYIISSRFPPKILGFISIKPEENQYINLKYYLDRIKELESDNVEVSPIQMNHSFSQKTQPQLIDEGDTNNITKNNGVIQNVDFGTEGHNISQSDNTTLHNNGQSINPSINSNSVVDIHSNSQSNVELTSNGYSMSKFKIKWGNFLDQIQAEIDESGGNELVPSLGNYNVNLKEALFLLNLIDFRKPEMFKVIENLNLTNLNIESLSTILINIIEAVNTQRIKHDPLTKYLEEHKTGTIDEDEPFFRIIGGSAATGSGNPVNNKGF